MPRKLKVFRAHLGFYDAIVAAPSQKAALEAWGARPQEFAQGFAPVTTDPTIVAAALEKPGVVLKRQFGSKGKFAPEPGRLRAPKVSTKKIAAADRKRKRRERAAKLKAEREELASAKREQAEALRAIEVRETELRAEKKICGHSSRRNEPGASAIPYDPNSKIVRDPAPAKSEE